MSSQKKYLEKKRVEMGEEEYKATQARKKREYRAKKREEKGLPVKEENKYMDELIKLFSATGGKGDKPLRQSSILNYANKFSRVAQIATGKAFDGKFDFLKNPEVVLRRLKDSGLKSLKDYISVCSKIAKHYNMGDDIVKEYQKYMVELKDDEYKQRGENLSTKSEKSRALKMPDIKKKISEYKWKTPQELVYKLITQLYFEGELIPRNNIIDMKLANANKKVKDMNADFNYILIDKEGTPTAIIMNRYKTESKYGRQRFTIPKSIADTIKEYIKEFGRKNGEYLLLTKTGEKFTGQQGQELIRKATQEVLGVPMNINLIRKIHTTDYYSGGMKSINEDKEFARRLLHSVEVGKEYAKKDLFDGDEGEDSGEESE